MHFDDLRISLGSRFCRYLWCSRSFWWSQDKLGKQIVWLFKMFALILVISGYAWSADFVVIYSVRAHFDDLMISLGSRLCRYLWCSRSFCWSQDKLGKRILLLFILFAISLMISGQAGEADFVAIYGVRARQANRRGRFVWLFIVFPLPWDRFCCYL